MEEGALCMQLGNLLQFSCLPEFPWSPTTKKLGAKGSLFLHTACIPPVLQMVEVQLNYRDINHLFLTRCTHNVKGTFEVFWTVHRYLGRGLSDCFAGSDLLISAASLLAYFNYGYTETMDNLVIWRQNEKNLVENGRLNGLIEDE